MLNSCFRSHNLLERLPTMSLQADVFEPDVVRGALKNLCKTGAEKAKFETDWKADVRIL